VCAHAAVLAFLLLENGNSISVPTPAPAGPPFRMVAAPKAAAPAAPSIPEPPVARKAEPPRVVAKAALPAKIKSQAPVAVAQAAQSIAASSAIDGAVAPASEAGGSVAGPVSDGEDARSVQLRPAYLSNPIPKYPLAAKRRGIEGRVLVHAEVDEHGLPNIVRLARSSGSDMLDNAAVEAVKEWRFSPAKQGGRPVRASIVVPIIFQLSGTVISAIN
jgi:protein TonB